jgi:hypothetical protein
VNFPLIIIIILLFINKGKFGILKKFKGIKVFYSLYNLI